MTQAARLPSEGLVLFILSAVQFIHIVDLMMVIPLGPDFAAALHIPLDQLGWVGGAYALAASLVGMFAAVYLDHYDRKRLLLICLGGLTVMTAVSALAWDFYSLVAIRFVTGMFGGPCTAICFAVIADCVPDKRRGSAMGKVMTAFSLASILGVPFGLEVAHYYDWRAPFIATATASVVVFLLAWRGMPSLTGHMVAGARISSFAALKGLLYNRLHVLVFVFTSMTMYAAFLLIPHLAAYVQFNLGLPRNELGWLYMAGGLASFAVLRVSGHILNHVDASKVAFFGMMVLVVTCYAGVIHTPTLLPPLAIYILFMTSMSVRGVCNNTLASKIPAPHQRAGFLALMNCIAQMFAALGAFTSTVLLHEAEDRSLEGFDHAAWLSIGVSLLVPPLMWWVEHHVRLRQRAAQLLPSPATL